MRLASITFIACAVLIASPDIALGASSGSKTGSKLNSKFRSKGSSGRNKPTPVSAPVAKSKTAARSKSKSVAPTKSVSTAPSTTASQSTASNSATSTSAAPTSTHLTHDMCPQNVLSCSTAALAKKTDTCCYEQYGVHVLTQQWNKDVGPADMFTLHGLWPSACKGRSPPTFGCDNSRRKRKVKSIIQAAKPELVADMLIYWPASDNKHDEFWGKEWTRHGTCATTLDPKCFKSYTQNEDIVEYFSNAIKLHKSHNYIPALASKGIVPDDTALVDPKDFKDAIKTKLNIDVEISCTQSADGTEEILNEVRTYFNVRLTSDYTLTAAKGRNSCTKPFKFPKKKSASSSSTPASASSTTSSASTSSSVSTASVQVTSA